MKNDKIKIDGMDEALLKIMAAFGMATVKIVGTIYPEADYPHFSDGTVRGMFTKFRDADMVEAIPVSLAGQAGHPEDAFLLTEYGIQICKQLDIKAYPFKVKDKPALAHRLCQAHIAAQARAAGLIAAVEEVLVFDRDDGNLRADVLVQGRNMEQDSLIIEVEQKLTLNNMIRAVEKFIDLAEIFSTRPDLHLSRQVLIVFNLKESEMDKPVKAWSTALGQAFPDQNIPFDAHYCTMKQFMGKPSFEDLSVYPKLEPIIKPARKSTRRRVRMPSKLEPKSNLRVEPSDFPPLVLSSRLDGAMAGYEPPTDEYYKEHFRGLADLAINIYDASFAPGMPADLNAAIPHASIASLRTYLFLPENEPLLRELQKGLVWLDKRQGGVTIFRDAVISLVWDVFMRYFGLAGDKSLAVAVEFPGLNDDVSRTRLTISFPKRSSLPGQDQTTELYDGTSSEQDRALNAISWMLTAIFIHSAELGLAESLWNKKKGKA